MEAGEESMDLVDDGFLVKIKRDSVAGKKDISNYYQVSWEQKNFVPIKYPLSDALLEERFNSIPTLTDLYENKYNAKMFNQALDGIQRFDEEHKYGAFSFDEFLDTVEEIAGYYPEEEEVEDAEVVDETPADEVPPPPTPKMEVDETLTEAVATEEAPAPVKKAASAKGTMSTADRLKAMKAEINKG